MGRYLEILDEAERRLGLRPNSRGAISAESAERSALSTGRQPTPTERQILEALAGQRVLTREQLEAETHLELGELHDILGALMDAGEVRTDPDAVYWRPVERCKRCERLRAEGVRVIFCSGCRFNPRNDREGEL